MYLFGAARKLPTTSAGHSSIPAQTPALHESAAGGYAAAPWRRSRQLRRRPAGTRVRCAAQTCYTSFGVDLWLQNGC